MVRSFVKYSDDYEILRNDVTLIINILDIPERDEVYCAEIMYEADIMNGFVGRCIIQTPYIESDADVMKQILSKKQIVDSINAITDASLERMSHDEWQDYYNPVG